MSTPISKLKGKHILFNGDFIPIQKMSYQFKHFTYLGNKMEVSIQITHNGKEHILQFIQGYDTLEIFDNIDLRAKVHRFLALKSREFSSYLMGIFFENISYKVIGDLVYIECDAYSVDGNFGDRTLEGKRIYTVTEKIINLSKEEITDYFKKKREGINK